MKLEKVQALLELGKWQEADRKTTEIMLEAVERTKEGWLRVEDIYSFTGEDLGKIDYLWRKYSNNRFGFSIQRKIFRELGGTQAFNFDLWYDFCDRVGWLDTERWRAEDDVSFQSKAALGHHPGDWSYFGLCLAHEACALLCRQDF